ncbi:unnamed protein product [Brassicogethes aeneus]|uniref:Translocator protein n=1 Tax=Brassicogethes aeneus TaxID=1431903 RepID=A0A9P0B2X6_BRAAE|nr:unnamed protein product [Brassicogethes aeneus]
MIAISWPAVGATILPNLGGIAGGFITRKQIKSKWYDSLKRPDWRPPNWAFGPVWTSLYCSMGYASYMVFRDGGGFNGPAKIPLMVYGTNLAFNWAWTPIFFGAHKLKLALYEIQLINATAVASAYLFYKINPKAGYIMVPYMVWLGLATALNYVIARDNPEGATIKEIQD